MNNTECNNDHRYADRFNELPHEQGASADTNVQVVLMRERFSGQTSKKGTLNIDLDSLRFSQAGNCTT